MSVVGIVSPGAMGSALGDALARGGAHVVATIDRRSERTAGLAGRAPIELLPDLAAVVRESEVLLSVVPPEAAESALADVAEAARRESVQPLVADLNAVSPAAARRLGEIAASVGCELVDGSISGPPPWKPGTTRVYLSGKRAHDIGALPFEGVERIVVGSEVGSASAVKMSTASVYKGTTAILAQALLTAHAYGVLEHVLADLRAASPELVANVGRRLASAAAKSGRYVGEMREIATTQAAAGLTPELFEAMATVYSALAESELARHTVPEDLPSEPELASLLDDLR